MRKKNIILKTMLAAAAIMAASSLASCGNAKKTAAGENIPVVAIQFNADSAYAFCAAQCGFGPRVMNTEAHDKCGEWIAEKFRQYGMQVVEQNVDLKGYDGTTLKCRNIIAQFKPELTSRILLCAHWDTRPWADNDPDSANWRKPVMGANDGASGVAVLIETARLLQQNDSLAFGVDFVCFDAEDSGTPQWSDIQDTGDSWALGAQHWAQHPHRDGYEARYGILLDMVGGAGARFYQEGMSKQFAQAIVDKVWSAARVAGYATLFPNETGGMVTDDHVPLNQYAKIPTVDIIAYYPDCGQSSFGPTWHTIHDTMDNIDRNSLKAVGQTVIQVLYSER